MNRGTRKTRVSVADWRVLDSDGTLVTSGLGSCVAVSVYDTEVGVGGLLHAMLPDAPNPADTPAKYVDSGVEEMLRALYDQGASPDSVVAKVVGGSAMLDISVGEAIGDRNVEAAERTLQAVGVPVVATETGGDAGRSVSFCTGNGEVTIQRVDSEVEVI